MPFSACREINSFAEVVKARIEATSVLGHLY